MFYGGLSLGFVEASHGQSDTSEATPALSWLDALVHCRSER